MGILGLLAEIYSMPNLKMNLKFDIEVWMRLLLQDRILLTILIGTMDTSSCKFSPDLLTERISLIKWNLHSQGRTLIRKDSKSFFTTTEFNSSSNFNLLLIVFVQVLFKNLSVDMKDITPTSLLKDRKREIEGNPDFSNKDVGASQTQMVPEVKSSIMSSLNQVDLPLEVAASSNSGNHTHLLSQVCYVLSFF